MYTMYTIVASPMEIPYRVEAKVVCMVYRVYRFVEATGATGTL
jgi:hypothetical protein